MWRLKLFFAVLTVLSLPYKCHGKTADQCPAQPAIYGKALKGYTFKTLVTSSSLECLVDCHYEDRCQSYNYVIKTNICEMNNRTKEAKPDQFVSDPDRFYMKRGAHRSKVIVTININCLWFYWSWTIILLNRNRHGHILFYLVAQSAMGTVRPIDLISRDWRTYQLVYRCAKKTK